VASGVKGERVAGRGLDSSLKANRIVVAKIRKRAIFSSSRWLAVWRGLASGKRKGEKIVLPRGVRATY
jgi:hypothetical protein